MGNGGQHFAMTGSLRFFADEFASFPLWSADGSADPDQLRESLPLSPELTRQLTEWSDEYTKRDLTGLTDDEVSEWYLDFDRRGLGLSERVSLELGPTMHVEYRFMTAELEGIVRQPSETESSPSA